MNSKEFRNLKSGQLIRRVVSVPIELMLILRVTKETSNEVWISVFSFQDLRRHSARCQHCEYYEIAE